MLRIYTDGAAIQNEATGYGYVIEKIEEIESGKGTIGKGTSNDAEMAGIYEGLKKAFSLGEKKVSIFSDSTLCVNVLSGRWRAKKDNIVAWRGKVWTLIKENHGDVRFEWIPREQNGKADALSKKALGHTIPLKEKLKNKRVKFMIREFSGHSQHLRSITEEGK